MSETNIKPQVKRIITTVLLLSTFLSLASQTMMITALNSISQQFQTSLTTAQWLTTGYALIIGVVTPLSANLYTNFSSRKLFLSIIAMLIAGTLLGCFAWDFWSILAARLVQAIGSGIIMSFTITTLVSINPPKKRGTVLGTAALVIATGPAVGPSLSGVILNFLSWHYLFILFLPLFLMIFLVGLAVFPDFSPKKTVKIDWTSIFVCLIGSTAALASLTVVETNALCGVLLFTFGAILLAFFYRRQNHLKQPLLVVSLLKEPSFLLMTVISMLVFMILLGTEQIVPLFSEQVLHTSTMTAGLMLLPGALINACIAPLSGRIYDEYGPKVIIFTGLAIILISSVPLLFINAHTPLWFIVTAYFVRMIGNALVFGPSISESFKHVAKKHISHATALNNALRQFAGALSVTLVVLVANGATTMTLGTHWGIWLTLILVLAAGATFAYYLKKFA